jgi:hypothetical protein
MSGTLWFILGACVVGTAVISLYGMYKNSEAFLRGYKDYLASNYTNPYTEGTQEHVDWIEGQCAAFTEASPWR